ncbi:MAG: tocopherol cyclase family protein [Brevefilum sp.]|nr:tocopherol cyclase family protein [Brevefilum sp.]
MIKSNILHPSRYHGFETKPPFFEGWYYKLVSKNEKQRLAVIPGVFLSEDKTKSHSFIQFFNSEKRRVHYHRFPIEAFSAAEDLFEIQIGSNTFASGKITLAMDDDLQKVQGSLTFEGLNRWPVRLSSPGAMGWFAWVPFMECYHGVVSMDHSIDGHLEMDGQLVDFSGGKGYIEKDWGKQFPSAWIWGQSNHFDVPGVSLVLSVAVIPWLRNSFGGFIIGLLYQGEILRFATYTRSKIEHLSVDDEQVNLVVQNTNYHLEIQAFRAGGGVLHAPTKVEMGRRILETLDAEIFIRLTNVKGDVLYQGTGKNGGLEVVGDMDQLLTLVM